MKELYRFRQYLTEGVIKEDEDEVDVNKILSNGGYDEIDDEELLATVKGRLKGKSNIGAKALNLLIMKIEDEEGGNIDFSEGKLHENEEQGYTLYDTNVEYDNGKTGYMFQLVNSEDREENEIGFDQLFFDDEDNRLEMGVDFNSFDQGSYQEGEYTADEAMELYRKINENLQDHSDEEELELDADYDKGGKYYSEEGAEAFRIQPFKQNDIEYTKDQAVRQGKYIVGLKGEELKKFISDYMAAWKEDKGDTPEGKTFKENKDYKNDYANSEEDYTDSMVIEKIKDIIKYHELDPSDVLEEIGQEFGIAFEFGRG